MNYAKAKKGHLQALLFILFIKSKGCYKVLVFFLNVNEKHNVFMMARVVQKKLKLCKGGTGPLHPLVWLQKGPDHQKIKWSSNLNYIYCSKQEVK